METQATCSTCPWWTETDLNVDPWTGKPWPEGKRPPRFVNAPPRGPCRRMPTHVEKLGTDYCGEHPDRQTLETKVRRLQMQPGDLVVVETRDHLNQEQRAALTRRWGEAFPGARAVVLEGGARLASVIEGQRRPPPALRMAWRRAARPGPGAWEGISGEHAAAILSGAIYLEGSPLRPDERAVLLATCRRAGVEPDPAIGGAVEPGPYVVGSEHTGCVLPSDIVERIERACAGGAPGAAPVAIRSEEALDPGALRRALEKAAPEVLRRALGRLDVHGAKPSAIRED